MWQGAGSPGRSSSAKGSRRPAIRRRSSGSSTTCSPPTRQSSPSIEAGKTNVAGFPRRPSDEGVAAAKPIPRSSTSWCVRSSVANSTIRDARSARLSRACAIASSGRRARSAGRALRAGARPALGLRTRAPRAAYTEAVRSLDRRIGLSRHAAPSIPDAFDAGGRRGAHARRRATCARSAKRLPRQPPRTVPSREQPELRDVTARLHAAARSRVARSPTPSTNAARCSTAPRPRSAAFGARLAQRAGRRTRPRQRDPRARRSTPKPFRIDRDDSQRALRHSDQSRVRRGVPGHRARHECQRTDALRRAARGARNEQPRAHPADRRGARDPAHPRSALARRRRSTPPQSKRTSRCSRDVDLLAARPSSRSAMHASCPS